MERERATRGTNRGAPRGIPRKTRSHQDSWMLALCCTDLTYWPLQLPCTINRDPARGALAIPKERGGGGEARKTKKKRKGRGEETWLVTLLQAGGSSLFLSFFFFLLPPLSLSFSSFHWLFSWSVCLFLSFFPFRSESLTLWERLGGC